MTVEQAAGHRLTEAERQAQGKVDVRADVVGGPERARELIAELVARSQADEVIVTSNTYSVQERLASYDRRPGRSDCRREPAARRARRERRTAVPRAGMGGGQVRGRG